MTMLQQRGIFVFTLLIVLIMPAVSLAGGGWFEDLQGPTSVQVGHTYTYSVIVRGDFVDVGWSPSGGQVVKEWWEAERYFCQVRWDDLNPDKKPKIKVWGKQPDGSFDDERLSVSEGTSSGRSVRYRSIQSAGGRCLDVDASQMTENGAKVQIWKCNDEPQQHWTFDRQRRLVNEGGLCLEVDPDNMRRNGAKIQVWECTDEPQQQWTLDKLGRLVNGGSGKCLDVLTKDLNKNGGLVRIWDCHTQKNQKWLIK